MLNIDTLVNRCVHITFIVIEIIISCPKNKLFEIALSERV